MLAEALISAIAGFRPGSVCCWYCQSEDRIQDVLVFPGDVSRRFALSPTVRVGDLKSCNCNKCMFVSKRIQHNALACKWSHKLRNTSILFKPSPHIHFVQQHGKRSSSTSSTSCWSHETRAVESWFHVPCWSILSLCGSIKGSRRTRWSRIVLSQGQGYLWAQGSGTPSFVVTVEWKRRPDGASLIFING